MRKLNLGNADFVEGKKFLLSLDNNLMKRVSKIANRSECTASMCIESAIKDFLEWEEKKQGVVRHG